MKSRFHPVLRSLICMTLMAAPASVAFAVDGLPLQAARTIEFDTDEGTWMSVDLSSDGKQIIFDLLGDLYVMAAEGGPARTLRTGFPFDSQPRYAPDGSLIAFVSDASGREGLWTMRADGTSPELLYEAADMGYATIASPAWAPDGRSIVFWSGVELDGDDSAARVPSLWQVDLRTREAHQLLDRRGRPLRGLSPAFSSDGRSLYFTEALQGERWNPGTDVSLPIYQVARYDFQAGIKQRISVPREGSFRPALSPDDRWMVYGSRYWNRTGLRIRNLATGADRWLAFPIDRDAMETFADLDLLPGVAFSADSRSVLAAFGGKIRRIDLQSGSSSVIPFQAHVNVPLGPLLRFPHAVEDSASVHAKQLQTPRLSPDGRQVAFGAFGEIWIMDASGRNARAITQGGKGVRYHPAWTADGRALVYCSWDAQDGGHVWQVNVASPAQPRRVSDPAESGFWLYPLVTDEGKIVASYTSQTDRLREMGINVWEGRSDNYSLRLLDGDAPRASILITPTEGPVVAQRSIDAQAIVFYEGASRYYFDRGADAQLVQVKLTGEDRRALLRIAGPLAPGSEIRTPASIALSPDGRRAVVKNATTSYLLSLPAATSRIEWTLADAIRNGTELADRGLDFIEWSRDGRRVLAAAGDSVFLGDMPATQSGTAGSPLQRIRPAVAAPRVRPTGTVLLSGARILTMKDREVIESGDVLIRDNRIVSVGSSGSLRVPAATRVIDLKGHTLAPGFFDSHFHTGPIVQAVPANPDWVLTATLAYGVTTAFDPDPVNANYCCTSWTLPYAELIETGRMLGPRLFTTGQGYRWHERSGRDSDAADAVKVRSDMGLNWAKYYLAGSRRHRQQFAIEALRARISPTVEGMGVMRKDLTYIQDGFAGHEHTIPYAPMYRDVREFIARSQSWITSTLVVVRGEGAPSSRWYYLDTADPSNDARFNRFLPPADVRRATARREWAFNDHEQAFSQYAEAAGSIVDAGGLITVGGHGEITGLQYHWEIWSLATGMSAYDALRAATIMPAKAHGLDQDLGSVEPGKFADLVVFKRNPLDNIRDTLSISHVIANGVIYDADTMDELHPVRKPFGSPWWSGLDSPR